MATWLLYDQKASLTNAEKPRLTLRPLWRLPPSIQSPHVYSRGKLAENCCLNWPQKMFAKLGRITPKYALTVATIIKDGTPSLIPFHLIPSQLTTKAVPHLYSIGCTMDVCGCVNTAWDIVLYGNKTRHYDGTGIPKKCTGMVQDICRGITRRPTSPCDDRC